MNCAPRIALADPQAWQVGAIASSRRYGRFDSSYGADDTGPNRTGAAIPKGRAAKSSTANPRYWRHTP